ncbi:MAG: DUF192 domain-containing protein [Candidatus Methanoperedens sp.]|nr:DUF192 domain-containing protein [Candidatus Methanoperedens sp.]MCZ7371390.1 DUF192 domain-containing protein [Candidatus Methanoperedens sp.]
MLHVLKYNGLEIAKNVELATSLLDQMLGLMFRKSLPPEFAMIFVMNRPMPVNIHMLFMRFPIDVVFLNEEKKITGLLRLNPWTGYKAVKNVKYVIEMNAGAIERFRLSIGGKIDFGDI